MHTRLINQYGGIVSIMPRYAIVFMIFTLGAVGLPGTTGFVGVFFILIGVFKKNFLVAVIASLGVILAAAYMLWLYKRVVFGQIQNDDLKKMIDLNYSEIIILWVLAIPTIFFGFYTEHLLSTIDISVKNLIDAYKSNLDFYLTNGQN